jgi:Zn-dependent peptidase ImmA (M78 family)/DNA-binding XRE family transcriptional regulator
MLSPSRLTVARKRRGKTKKELAEATGLSVRSIAAYEGGSASPSSATLDVLAAALGFPREFLLAPEIEQPAAGVASFRALKAMKARQRDSALAAGALGVELARWIGKRFSLPAATLPDCRGLTPERAAEYVRDQWQLGERPIRNMIHLLEQHGVRVFSLVEDGREVDAFSFWSGGVPFIFLNTLKSGERGRFDCAHELGHLVLHRSGGPTGREVEQEADAFAAAFLMPRSGVIAIVPHWPTVNQLVQLKRNWQVSVGALAHRAHEVGLVTDWHYRTLCIEISQRHFRINEPLGIDRERSQVLRKVFLAMRDEGMGVREVAAELKVPVSDLQVLLFGHILVVLTGGASAQNSVAASADVRLQENLKIADDSLGELSPDEL